MGADVSTPTLEPGSGLREVLVDAPGRRFRTVQAGTGPVTVVFESGLSACASEWVAVQRRVAAVTATLSYDRAGYGGSAPAADDRRLAALAQDLEVVLTAAGVTGPVVLVGHSWGGPVLRTFLRTSTRDVRGVVIVDGTVSAVMTDVDARRARRAFTLLARLARVGLSRPLVARTLRRVSTGLSPEDAALGLRDMARPQDAQAARREATALPAEAPALPALEEAGFPPTVPVTLVVGRLADGRQVQAREAQLAFAAAEAGRVGARLVVAEGSSHFVPQQEPGLVAAEVLALVGERADSA